MKIIDLVSLNAFFDELASTVPGIEHYLSLSNGEKAVDEIAAYYTNDYAGTTVFFQVAESVRKDGLLTFQCSLTIATKPAGETATAALVARDQTLKLMLDLLGRLEIKADESATEIEDLGDMYDLIVTPVDRIFPIGLLANVNLEGHYVDIDVRVPVTHLLFPA
jgi:hypothetical protein